MREIRSLLRQDREAAVLSSAQLAQIVAAADAQGVLCLVARAVRSAGVGLDAALHDQITAATHQEQALELVRRTELRRTLCALHEAGVGVLVFKGAALAYTHYPHPHLRPRVDTDLLVREADRARASDALLALGYEKLLAVDRDAIFTQASFQKAGTGRVCHLVDLHWKVFNRRLFRDLFSFDELTAGAVTIQAIDPKAKTADAVYSLLLACVHPVAHHHNEWPLIWSYDISLLAGSLTASDWDRFRAIARAKRMVAVCRAALRVAEESLGPHDWWRRSGIEQLKFNEPEPSAKYLARDLGARRDLALDLSASSGTSERCRLLLSHAFPDVRYMREKYATSSWTDLALAYGWRLWSGRNKPC